MIFENGKEITRICENGKDIIARYCEGHLLWSSGIKLKSLLGKQNTEQSITLSSPLNLNTAVGFGMSGNGITYPNNLLGGSYGKPIEIKETHYYLYAIKVNKNVLSTANTWGGFYFSTRGGYIDNQTMAYTDGEWYLGIQKANKSLINDNFFGIFARSLALNTGDIITCYKSFILDLTQAKLDTLTAEQVYNLITLNGTDFTNIELLASGYEIKLGSFKQQGNAIAGSKYGFVKLKDLTWYYNAESGHERFYTTCDLKRPTTLGNVANIFCEEYETVSANNLYGGGSSFKRIASYIAQNNNLQISDNRYTNATDFKNSLKGKYLIYELNNSLGNKLDNYTAEQVYYMFFATLGMSKMYVPYGKRFESSDNIILGTKYGIVDLGGLTWYRFNSTDKRVYSYSLQNVIKRVSSITKPNIFCINYKTDTHTNVWDNVVNNTICVGSDGFIGITDDNYTTKDIFKGKYLIYELATPDGTDYNDLIAKQMYDLINTNKIDVIADGKSVDGVRNLLGKQNVATKKKNTGFYKCHTDNTWKENFNSEETSKIATLNTSHKYCCIIHATDVSNSEYEMGNIAYKENALAWASISNVNLFRDTEYISITFNCADTKVRFGYMGNTNATIYSQVVIDLTEHNLQNLTAQEAYQYFKEHNLFNLSTTGVINIGGLKPKVVARKPTFTIEGTPYQFESGMTWLSWCSSSYNTANLVCEDIVHTSDYSYSLFNNDKSEKISPSAVIIENYEYKLS